MRTKQRFLIDITAQDAAKELLTRRAARKDLIGFTGYTFGGFEPSAHHKVISDVLTEIIHKVECKESAREMIFLPPRHSKSELGTRRLPAFALGLHPEWQIATAAYGGDFAKDFGRDVRSIIKSDSYKILFPGTTLSTDVKAADRWNTAQGGIYVAVGIEGGLTGRGAHLMIIDDPFKDWKTVQSPTIRAAVFDWYKTVARTRLMPGGAIIIINTRWHDQDLCGMLLQEMSDHVAAGTEYYDKWHVTDIPAVIETEQERVKDVLNRDMGEALWPEWFPLPELMTLKSALTKMHWSALYQNKPVPDGGVMFQRDRFNWYTQRPEKLNVFITHDDSVTPDGGDWTEIGVWGVDYLDNLYCLDWYSGQDGSDVWIEKLIDMMLYYKPFVCAGEKGPIRLSIEPFLKKRMRQRKCRVRLDWLSAAGDKPTKASAFAAMVDMGQVFLPEGRPWAISLIDQLIRFPAGADDKVDTCGIMGRLIDQTYAPKLEKPVVKRDMHEKETLNQMLINDSKQVRTNGRW